MSHEIPNILLILLVVWGVGLAFRAMKLPLLLGEVLAGMFLPLLLGTAIGLAFGATMMQSLFIGTGMSITANPVTVKIFKDFNFTDRKLINLVMAAALADDILAVVLVLVVLTLATAGTLTALDTLLVILKVAGFFAAIIFIGGWMLKPRFKHFFSTLGGTAFPLTIILGLFFGLIAEKLGIHYLIGAYMAGLFMKKDYINPAVFERIEDRLNGCACGFLGPIFFVSLGFSVEFATFAEPSSFKFLIREDGKIIGA